MPTAFFHFYCVAYSGFVYQKQDNSSPRPAEISCTEPLSLLQEQSSHLYFPLSIFAVPGTSYNGSQQGHSDKNCFIKWRHLTMTQLREVDQVTSMKEEEKKKKKKGLHCLCTPTRSTQDPSPGPPRIVFVFHNWMIRQCRGKKEESSFRWVQRNIHFVSLSVRTVIAVKCSN